MILKFYEISKIDISLHNLILFYGNNEGLKKEEILKLYSKTDKKIYKYEEKQILENSHNFFENLYSGSLFENEKFIIINRATDKILKIIDEILEKKVKDTTIIINAGILEKKSKLRAKFEKNKNLVCVAFYPDNNETLSRLVNNYIKYKNISLSQMKVNFIVNKCNGNREFLSNELEKIYHLSKTRKNIEHEDLVKLINLNEDYSVTELIDNCLAKNQKKTFNIINENNFNNDDSVIIVRTFINKLKRNLNLAKIYQSNNNIEKTINDAKPPIFWKEKEIVKNQIKNWTTKNIEELIVQINNIELNIKKNSNNAIKMVLDIIIKSCSKTNN
tara:strand:+ start:370 stop:1362 length:993 start_codon:yes stop_codon:yes gene_type:complete